MHGVCGSLRTESRQVFSIRKARKAPLEGKRDWHIFSISLPVNMQNALSNGKAKTAPFTTDLYPDVSANRFSSPKE